MRSLVVLVLLGACGRGHHESVKMSTEMHAKLTSITDDGCELRHAETERPLEQCVSRDGRIRAWLILDADGLSTFVSTVNGTSVNLPSTVRLLPGAEYRWWVVARRADGSRIGAVPRRLRIEDGRGGGGSARTGPVSPTVVLS